ncbi:phospholipase-like protein [Tanacetum coccineum]
MLRKQHKVDEYHNDMPLIYYVEGHSLHFGRPEFALITGMRFGTTRFCSYTSVDLKFRNRVFLHKVGLVVTILDVLGVIEDEVMFGNLCNEDSVRRCLILALEVIFMGSLLTCPMDDSLFGSVENLEAWNVFPWGEHVLALERNDKLGRFEDLSRLRGDFVESLNILFQELVDPHDSVEDIANEYLVDEELKLCLEEEERIRSEQEKRIQQEKRLRLEEEEMLRLEEEKMLQIAEHMDLWVDYMWHGRRENANWSMVFIPINETDHHWCLAHLDILSGLVTFYDSGDTYDYEWRDCTNGVSTASTNLVLPTLVNTARRKINTADGQSC